MPEVATDKWLDWLTNKRHGGNREIAEATIRGLTPIRNKIFERIPLEPGATVLDVGTGDGFIAIEAMKRVGTKGEVIFSDISQASLDHCERFVATLEERPRVRFVNCPAHNLSAIEDNSVDVITLRSVLIYEARKQDAFKEFLRVLKPGGFVSMFEPIARIYNSYTMPNTLFGYDLTEVKDLFPKLKAGMGRTGVPAPEEVDKKSDDPMSDFDDRDLARMALDAGFREFKLETTTEYGSAPMYMGNWEAFWNSSPNPNAPSLREAAERSMSSDELARFINVLKPKVESGESVRRAQAWCFLAAMK